MDFAKRIYPGVTGFRNSDWQSKLKELEQSGITKAAVFVERFRKRDRDNMYRMLLKSSIKEVPLVHLRDDCTKDEIQFFMNNFGTRYFNIHEHSFDKLDQWRSYWGKLYLEMNYDGTIARNVEVKKIGGFCIDLAHFKTAIARGSEEAYYAFISKNNVKFSCNHLSGYSPERNKDVHSVKSFGEFDYLASLPKWIFGEIIAMEINNPIKDQLKFIAYAADILNNNFK